MLLFVLVLLFADPKTSELNTGVGYFHDKAACEQALAKETSRLLVAGVTDLGGSCQAVTFGKAS